MDYHDTVSKIFDYFNYKRYKNANYKLDLSRNKQHKQVDNFIQLFSKHYPLPSIGINLLVDYFSFAFEYWSNKETKRNVSLGWIIGKKTFQRWLEHSDHSAYFNRKFFLEYDINIDQLKQDLFASETVLPDLDHVEELEKQRHDGVARFYHCVQYTTLYNHRSGICLLCSQRTDCKILLKTKYPITYKKRGYA
jgi:hypothetical protein